jgi:hypothetical protein
MPTLKDDFDKYAIKHRGISSLAMHQYLSVYNNYISPTIIEERQLNIATMDVFSRLMMDMIIFLGLPIDDYVSNIIEAQLLYLDSADPTKDIQIYFNTPVGRYMPDWESMTLCNGLQPTWPQYVPGWLHPWGPFCWRPEPKENVQP